MIQANLKSIRKMLNQVIDLQLRDGIDLGHFFFTLDPANQMAGFGFSAYSDFLFVFPVKTDEELRWTKILNLEKFAYQLRNYPPNIRDIDLEFSAEVLNMDLEEGLAQVITERVYSFNFSEPTVLPSTEQYHQSTTLSLEEYRSILAFFMIEPDQDQKVYYNSQEESISFITPSHYNPVINTFVKHRKDSINQHGYFNRNHLTMLALATRNNKAASVGIIECRASRSVKLFIPMGKGYLMVYTDLSMGLVSIQPALDDNSKTITIAAKDFWNLLDKYQKHIQGKRSIRHNIWSLRLQVNRIIDDITKSEIYIRSNKQKITYLNNPQFANFNICMSQLEPLLIVKNEPGMVALRFYDDPAIPMEITWLQYGTRAIKIYLPNLASNLKTARVFSKEIKQAKIQLQQGEFNQPMLVKTDQHTVLKNREFYLLPAPEGVLLNSAYNFLVA